MGKAFSDIQVYTIITYQQFFFLAHFFLQLGLIGLLFSLQARRYLQPANIFRNYTRGAPARILQSPFGLLPAHTRHFVSHFMCDTRSVCVAPVHVRNGCLYFYRFARSALRDHCNSGRRVYLEISRLETRTAFCFFLKK